MDIKDLTPESVIANEFALKMELCKLKVDYFIQEFVKIEDRDSVELIIPFTLWDAQRGVLVQFLTERLLQVLKARQLGLTWLALAYCAWNMIFKKGYSALVLSKTDDDAKELTRRMVFILRHLPSWMLGENQWSYTTSDVVVKKNSEPSTFQSFTASQNSGRTFTGNLLLLDEWAFQQWAREIWRSAFPTVNRPTGGQVIGISTIERGTLFEDLWMNPDSGFKKIFLPWHSDPRRTQKWYDDTRKAMGDGIMAEYPATVEEAFAIPGGAFFTEFRTGIHLKPALVDIPNYYVRYRVIDYGMDMLACYWIYIDTQGKGRVYRELHQSGLVISQAAYMIHKMSGKIMPKTVEEWDALTREQKNQLARTEGENIFLTFAPPDLFNKQSQTGRASSDVWQDNGIALIKTNNDFEAGCLAMAEWLHPIEETDEQNGDKYWTAKLTIDETCAPQLVNDLLNIQKDKHNPKVYAKQPHQLTHGVDAIRYFCTEYTSVARVPKKPQVRRVIEWEDEEVLAGRTSL